MNPRLAELSRKAATGTLTEAERAWLAAHLRDHPAERAELEWDRQFSTTLSEKVAAMPLMPGWERTARELRAGPARERAPGVLDRLSDWLAATLGVPLNAQAIAAALVLVQAGVIGVLAWQSQGVDDSAVRAAAPDSAPRGPLLRVSFRPELREADLRRALTDAGAEIVGGPGQIGIYLLRVQAGDLAAAAQRLRASGTTELVETIEAR